MEACSDILWRTLFIEHWNGLSIMYNLRRANPDFILTSDASGSWGCGAFSFFSWFQYQWPQQFDTKYITVKELFPSVIAVAIWGHKWENRSVLYRHRCDNEAVVHINNTGTSKVMACAAYTSLPYSLTCLSHPCMCPVLTMI